MKTASVRRNNFDLLRLFAASQVVWNHASTHLALPTPALLATILDGLPGVPIFFVISGFLISASYERCVASGNAGTYYLNRILRIYPALWVALLIGIASVVTFGSATFYSASGLELIKWVIAQMTVVQFYNPEFLRNYGVGVLNGSLWTIPVELEFYVLLPVIYRALRIKASVTRANPALLGMVALCVMIHLWFVNLPPSAEHRMWYKLLKVSLAPYLYVFLIGVLLQRNLPTLRPFLAGRAAWWIGGYAVVASCLTHIGWSASGNDISVPLMFVLACTVVSCAYSAPSLAERVLQHRDLSYGTYVYHMLVVNALVQLGFRGTGWPIGITTFVAVYVLAFVSWTWIEAPALALRSRLAGEPASLVDAV